MTLTIELAPEVEQQLQEIAALQGQDPASYAKAAVEEKLRDAALSATANGSHTNGEPSNGQVPNRQQVESGQTLDKMLAGRTGRVNFGPSDLSTRTEEAFGEIVTEKFRMQGLDV